MKYHFNHRPILDIGRLIKLYEKKDGVPIKYVCTTERSGDNKPRDIFYRDTPHPKFSNKYFGLYWDETTRLTKDKRLMIGSCDWVEGEAFDMIQDNAGVYQYSRYRHDYFSFDDMAIDGGRAYTRVVNPSYKPVETFRGVCKVTEKLKVLDLFSGIGMFSYGLEKTGLYETTAFCEWDNKCQQVLKKHWPGRTCYGDISELHLDEGFCDVITGGFPCQDISLAGHGAGIEGERSGHWKHYKRLISTIKPKGVIIENVSALRDRGLETVLQDLNKIGYDAEWHCITAKYFGAYHERDRIFILAYSQCIGRERFKPLEYLEKVGQGWESCKENLFKIYNNPFGRSDCSPQPLLCGMDVRNPGRVDRLKQVGNTVYWPIVERLGVHLYDNINRSSL
jgi:hypothetical protein